MLRLFTSMPQMKRQACPVRYRKEFLLKKFSEFITSKKERITIASLACGPAREVVEYLESAPQEDITRISFLLMDQDTEALLNAKKNTQRIILNRGIDVDITFAQISVRDILDVSSQVQEIKNMGIDFIYSAGLYDYLSQPLARALTRELCSLLQPNGQVVIGNFHPNNPTKAISEFSADWRLVHRTEGEMLDLVPAEYKGTSESRWTINKSNCFSRLM